MWIPVFIYCTFVLAVLYTGIMLAYRYWFMRLPVYVPKEDVLGSSTFFTVIIPARNEEQHIEACVYSILNGTYSKDHFEIWVVDDHSTDRTPFIVEEIARQYHHVHLLKLADHVSDPALVAYKKKAIELAVAKSKGNWIVTTDADCKLPVEWLRLMNHFICTHDVVMVAAPVIFQEDEEVHSIFQTIDFMTLQGITAAAVSAGVHAMCNGANLAYEKKAFLEVNGFAGIDHKASGDDMLLMSKLKEKFPGKIGFLYHPNAVVTTYPMPSWKAFINQRVRWASKSSQYKDLSILAVLVIVYMWNLSLFLLPFLGFWYPGIWLMTLLLIGYKALIEFSFVIPVARFFKKLDLLNWFIVLQPLHIGYMVIAGWLGNMSRYTWKGRNVR